MRKSVTGYLFLFQQSSSLGFRHTFVVVRTMPATMPAAIPFFQVMLFGKHHISVAVVIKIYRLNQVLLH